MTDHIHKYYKISSSPSWIIFRCVEPNCSHYINEKFIPGRQSICWKCNKPFTINPTVNYKRLAKKPACCRGEKKKKLEGTEEKELDSVLKDLGI